MLIQENVPLAPYTTFGIGGPARWFVEAQSEAEIAESCAWAEERNAALFVLGGGSNILVADKGFSGLVLRIATGGIEAFEEQGRKVYRAVAGEDWDRFVERTVEDGCSGLECLAGIPGTVGGTPVQNVGAYGQEVASAIDRVRAFDLKEQSFVEFSNTECGFAYRHSRFNSTDRGRYIVTRVDYRVTPGGKPALRYADLQRAFSDRITPRLAEVTAEVRRVRQSKGMLMVEGDPDCRSAGSFFKNPVVGEDRIQQIAAQTGKEPPRFPAGPGMAKLPAAWLIEQSGFAKGYALGAAGVSSRHTLALVNRGGATAQQILELARQITSRVEAKFGVCLVQEPVLVGF